MRIQALSAVVVVCTGMVCADDVVPQVRSAVAAVVSALPEGRQGTSTYLQEFGFPLKRLSAYQELVGVVSNNQEMVCSNFVACASNELARMVLLAAWWGGDDALYISGLSRGLDLATAGVVSHKELNWYQSGHRSERRGNILALRYDEPGISNLVLRLCEFTGETNVCRRILSGEARTSITNYLEEISHIK